MIFIVLINYIIKLNNNYIYQIYNLIMNIRILCYYNLRNTQRLNLMESIHLINCKNNYIYLYKILF